MGCCASDTKNDDFPKPSFPSTTTTTEKNNYSEKESNSEKQFFFKNKVLENYFKSNPEVYSALKNEGNLDFEQFSLKIEDLKIEKQLLDKFRHKQDFFSNFCDYIAKDYILGSMKFKEYDAISIIENIMKSTSLQAVELEKIHKLINLYLLFFKRNKKGIKYSLDQIGIKHLSIVNDTMIRQPMFNKIEVLTLMLDDENEDINKAIITGSIQLIKTLNTIKTVILNIRALSEQHSELIDVISNNNKSVCYLVVIFTDYIVPTEKFFTSVLDLMKKDKLYAAYFYKWELELDKVSTLMGSAVQAKKLKFFGVDLKFIGDIVRSRINEIFSRDTCLYIVVITAENFETEDHDINAVTKENVLKNSNLKLFHLQKSFKLFI